MPDEIAVQFASSHTDRHRHRPPHGAPSGRGESCHDSRVWAVGILMVDLLLPDTASANTACAVRAADNSQKDNLHTDATRGDGT